jgi:hypothetical protein
MQISASPGCRLFLRAAAGSKSVQQADKGRPHATRTAPSEGASGDRADRAGMTTRWRMSLVKLIPLRTHFMMDVAVGIALIVLPFVAGFSDHGGATRFFVIAGVLELGTALMTRWDEREEVGAERRGRTHPAR